MSRVTPEEVKAIVSTELADPVIQVWIDGANSVVNANADCIGDDEDLLTQVELYLSAHFVAMLDSETRGYVTKDKIDTFDTSYSTPIGLNNIMDNTAYGTTANMISGGCLANANDRAVSFCSV